MTLTHLMPSLRRTLPDPLARDRWPEFTVVSTTDVTIAGVSLLRLVDWCSTPCVHTAAAVLPGTNGRPSETELASVVVTRITAVLPGSGGEQQVRIDAELDGCRPVLTECRLIGRASTAHTRPVALQSASTGSAHPVSLPADLRVGDLVVVPCSGATSLHSVRSTSPGPRSIPQGLAEHGNNDARFGGLR